MRLSIRVLVLWYLRTALAFVLISVAILYFSKISEHSPLFAMLVLTLITVAAMSVLYIRYRSLRIFIKEDCLILCVGLILYKEVFVRYKSVCASRLITSPLSRSLKLCNTVIYCEGKWFVLPAMPMLTAKEIESNIEKVGVSL